MSTDLWEVSGGTCLGVWMQLQNNPVCTKAWGLGGCSVKDFLLPAALEESLEARAVGVCENSLKVSSFLEEFGAGLLWTGCHHRHKVNKYKYSFFQV